MNVKNFFSSQLKFGVTYLILAPLALAAPLLSSASALNADTELISIVVKDRNGTVQVLDSQGNPVTPYGTAQQFFGNRSSDSSANITSDSFFLNYQITPLSSVQSSNMNFSKGDRFMMRPASFIKVQSNYPCTYVAYYAGNIYLYPPGCNPNIH